jgi:hypothetical protein
MTMQLAEKCTSGSSLEAKMTELLLDSSEKSSHLHAQQGKCGVNRTQTERREGICATDTHGVAFARSSPQIGARQELSAQCSALFERPGWIGVVHRASSNVQMRMNSFAP